jgi:stage III sporulation protein AA
VVDERGELFPTVNGESIFPPGYRTDVMTMCAKPHGVLTALKTMGPGCIAVDEITAYEDLQAVTQAFWCGVDILATLHAGSIRDLRKNELYRSVLGSSIFSMILVMKTDKSWKLERIEP